VDGKSREKEGMIMGMNSSPAQMISLADFADINFIVRSGDE
jgi:hypothetical protein